ncbi:homoserine dehydrogenase [Chondrinema litorale]|uniref:homoserine dehydrogenase n=1 Tax=Chondrinema litorale TaxID=2994555 RepID=UPI002542D4EA|nr:homoserine dehydrogenase [Chondrinema litorale]UZR92589.1 homoserine dehydrogenase [Chondrinema litorale]
MGKSVKIGLFGFGVVGQGLYKVLSQSTGINAEIKKIAVKNREKKRSLPAKHFTFDAEEILFDDEINLIVELIDNAEDAYKIITTALKNGKNVVTANKKLLAENFEELVNLQLETGKSILYEASVCAGIPIIRTIEEYYVSELLYSVEGIFNGSSNYILSKMQSESLEYSEALKQAQELGFAESNPKLDVEGFDAKFKLIILAAHSFGVYIHPEKIFNYGIAGISSFDIQFAKEKNWKIKLMSRVFKNSDNTISMYVIPEFVNQQSNLFLVDQEFNGVIVEAAFSDRQFYSGKGAGGYPTGSAVLSDIAANAYDYKYEYHKTHKELQYSYSNDIYLTTYVRFIKDLTISEYFEAVHQKFENPDNKYVIGKISITALSKLLTDHKEDIQFICNIGENII